MSCVSYLNKQQNFFPIPRCCEVDCDELATKFLSFVIILTPICLYSMSIQFFCVPVK